MPNEDRRQASNQTGSETGGQPDTQDAIRALARVDALHTALTQIVLEGGNLSQIAAEVARVLDVGVLITSTDGRERAAEVPDSLRGLMDDAELFDPTGRFRVERADAEGVSVGAGQVRMLRIVAGGADLARLVCFRETSEISSGDVHAMERAAAVAALLITREEAVSAVENKYQGDFLRDVLLRRAGAEEYVVEHVEAFGWNLARPMVVVAAEIDPAPADEPPTSNRIRRRWQERFSAAWSQVSHAFDPGVPSVDFSSEVVTLVPVPQGAADGGAARVRQLVSEVAGDKGGGRRPFSVGVSRVAGDIESLPEAYAQARRAVEVGRRVHGGGSTTYFDQLGVHRLIALVPDHDELRAFAHDVLGELAGSAPEVVDLRETLQMLLDTNFNVAEAARLQFFHYNTMRYRVGKLERLLGPVASDPHLRLDVAVALRVLEIAE
ncbi:PucR family transcriptional regulator [Nocardioides jensenii]|uniref:PucR family transcriptional regulator n=1 Tax=Nocardioides jensenii TaxID=1843 RepID=UPI00083714D5|nr:helix-turn-helix domain-containing protein [Nocardioides jensenii]